MTENKKPTCFYCGHELCWDSDFNASDIYAGYEDDETAAASFYHCPHCGRTYEVVEPIREEKELNYNKYWGDN